MQHRFLPKLVASLVFGALGAVPMVQAQTVTWNPPIRDFSLNPGEQAQITATVCLPGQPAKVDIYILADVTTSMTPFLNQLKNDAVSVVTTLLATPGLDMRVGLGSYRDFPFDIPFVHQVSPTTNVGDLVAGINTWVANGGGDGSEGQFYAMHEISLDPAIGFRPDAKRVIAWFGDSPAHDPICDIFVGFGVPTFEIDEALLTSVLQSSGVGGTTVIAIGTPTSQLVYPQALNSDPNLFAEDYIPFCTPNGVPGQASRLAAATGGVSSLITDAADITDAILDAVSSVLSFADVGLTALGDTVPFISAITPASYDDVALPNDPEETVCVEFVVDLVGPPCVPQVFEYDGLLLVDVNGTPLDDHELSITQSTCYTPYSVLYVGVRRIDVPLKWSGDPSDHLLAFPNIVLPGTGLTFPTIPIPNDPIIAGFEGFAQVALEDFLNFPADPVKTSNGLVFHLGANNLGTNYQAGSGLSLFLAQPALVGGTFEVDAQFLP